MIRPSATGLVDNFSIDHVDNILGNVGGMIAPTVVEPSIMILSDAAAWKGASPRIKVFTRRCRSYEMMFWRDDDLLGVVAGMMLK